VSFIAQTLYSQPSKGIFKAKSMLNITCRFVVAIYSYSDAIP